MESSKSGHTGSFSLFSLKCQAVAMVAFGISSYIRIRTARPDCAGLFGRRRDLHHDGPFYMADGMFTPWVVAAGQIVLWCVILRATKNNRIFGMDEQSILLS